MSVLAAVVFGGCGRGTSPSDRAAAHDSLPAGAPQAADTTFHRGLARLNSTQLLFTACDGPPEAPLEERSGGAVANAVKSLAGGDGATKVYVEFTGGNAGGTLAAYELLRAAPVGEGGGCERPVGTYLYQAFGNEPFWSVTVWEDSVVFAQPDDPARVAWPSTQVKATRDPAGTRTWTAQDHGGLPVLTLTIDRATCTDGMSGEVTTFRARARLSGRELHGCARAGAAADEARKR